MLESFYGSDKLPRETIEKLREIADAKPVTITRGEYENLKRQVAEAGKPWDEIRRLAFELSGK